MTLIKTDLSGAVAITGDGVVILDLCLTLVMAFNIEASFTCHTWCGADPCFDL
jgi:hypothetical protein